jgi:hypothetical protein
MLNEKYEAHQSKVIVVFDKNTKKNDFETGYLIPRWDARREEKFKHGKFDNLWFGPFKIAKILNNNTFVLQNFG